jgi:hypothetical protein
VDGIQNLSCAVIHLGEAIGPIAVPGLSNKQSRALACQLVNAWCRIASQDSAAINAELPVTEVVDENKNDIRPRRSNRNLRAQPASGLRSVRKTANAK